MSVKCGMGHLELMVGHRDVLLISKRDRCSGKGYWSRQVMSSFGRMGRDSCDSMVRILECWILRARGRMMGYRGSMLDNRGWMMGYRCGMVNDWCRMMRYWGRMVGYGMMIRQRCRMMMSWR